MALEDLSPAYRQQYKSALPEITRQARSASNARGMFYSGDAIDSETRAAEDLLAKLSGESAGASERSSENAKNRAAEQRMADQNAAATKRAQTLGIVGTGLGAAGTLAGLKYLNPKVGGNLFQSPNGNLYQIGADGKASIVNLPGSGQVGGAALAPTAPTFNPANPVESAMAGLPGAPAGTSNVVTPFAPQANGGFNVTAGAAGPGTPVAAAPSMWQKAGANPAAGLGAIGAGAGGGVVGNMLASKIGGGGGLGTDIGSGLGGLAGGLGGYAYGMSQNSPWFGAGLAGLGALGGSLGGGLIGNLFK